MEIREDREQHVTVVTLDGRFDATAAPEAESAFGRVLESGVNHVTLDLSGVEYISSGGLRVVIMLLKALEKTGGKLALCGLSPFVSEVFEITNLNQRFTIRSSRDEALASFEI